MMKEVSDERSDTDQIVCKAAQCTVITFVLKKKTPRTEVD